MSNTTCAQRHSHDGRKKEKVRERGEIENELQVKSFVVRLGSVLWQPAMEQVRTGSVGSSSAENVKDCEATIV